MRRLRVELLLLQLCTVTAVDFVYITDLPIFTSLAPCAQDAVSYEVLGLTESACPEAVTALESCACSQDHNSASVASAISSAVLYNCDATDTEDVASASAVFSNYCNQASPAPAVTPAPTLVSQYITDLSAFSELAPCAQNALSYAILPLTESLCPSGQSALESCACTKNQNSLAVSEQINTQVLYYCGSTASADVTSAQAIFAGYCEMGAGKTSFPSPGSISGTITYYITDLPAFGSLAPCAATAISDVVLGLTVSSCQSAPNALASCACFKDQNSADVSSSLVSGVEYECTSTASADVTSAVELLNYYCSAAAGQIVATGVTASVAAATGGSAATSNGASPIATANFPGASATAVGGSSGGNSTISSSKKSSNGALIGGIAGGVGAVALIGIGVIIWLCRRKRNQRAPLPSTAGSGPTNQDSKMNVELHQYSKMSSPSLKPQQDGVYEVPAGQGISEMPNKTAYAQAEGKYTSPSQYKAPSAISSPSMHAVSPIYEAGGRPAVPEMPNNSMGYYAPQQQAGYPNQVYEMAPGQQYQLQPPHQLQPHAITTYNNAGPIYEMYSPDPR